MQHKSKFFVCSSSVYMSVADRRLIFDVFSQQTDEGKHFIVPGTL